ncbi:MAG: hypothetical protein Q8911_01430 [Bacillota bacterium]|nr:hypothetical protein [Bacillota bacterium]
MQKIRVKPKIKTNIDKTKGEIRILSQSTGCTENRCIEECAVEIDLEEREEEYAVETVHEAQEEGCAVEAVLEAREKECAVETIIEEQTKEDPNVGTIAEESNKDTLIDQLIDQGFKEKYSDNLDKAVDLFSKALSLDPIPDLALYLIIDCYWLWNNLGERDYALTQLQVYIERYLPQFNSDLRHQFDTWMTQENIYCLKL